LVPKHQPNNGVFLTAYPVLTKYLCKKKIFVILISADTEGVG